MGDVFCERGKDMPDILHLIRSCQIDMRDPVFQNILNDYANEETRKLLLTFQRPE